MIATTRWFLVLAIVAFHAGLHPAAVRAEEDSAERATLAALQERLAALAGRLEREAAAAIKNHDSLAKLADSAEAELDQTLKTKTAALKAKADALEQDRQELLSARMKVATKSPVGKEELQKAIHQLELLLAEFEPLSIPANALPELQRAAGGLEVLENQLRDGLRRFRGTARVARELGVRIEAQLVQQSDAVATTQERLEQLRAMLVQVKTALVEGVAVQIGGMQVEPGELKKVGVELIEAFKTTQAKLLASEGALVRLRDQKAKLAQSAEKLQTLLGSREEASQKAIQRKMEIAKRIQGKSVPIADLLAEVNGLKEEMADVVRTLPTVSDPPGDNQPPLP